ncbi:Ig-like domain-containing protein [Duganella alba]|nr:Ig-like domain-containing protein [Duganella alba]
MSNQNRTYNSVLFIDAGVANADALAAGVADDVLVVKLASWRDGVEQIATVLRDYQGLDSIQIISHGAAGQLQLGNTVLDAAHLEQYQAAVREWGAALGADGDLLLYGCDVAAGVAGQSFVDALAFISGADVAASTNLTGAHGDWELEYHSGAIEAAGAVSLAAQQSYEADLALVNNGNNGTITFSTNANVTLLNATGLVAGAVVHVDNILGLGLDLYTQSTNGGGVAVVNVNGSNLIGIPLSDDRLTVNGSLFSPVSYVDLRANSGVFDAVSLNLGSGSLLGNLLGTVVYTVYALDANYQPTGVGVSLTSLLVNEYGLLNFDSMANFKGIYGIRIVNPLGMEVAIDDLQIANARAANSVTSAAYNAGTGVLNITASGIRAGDAIDPTKFTITGANGASYTLTSPVVGASSTTAAAITLNAADKLAINGLLNNNGSSSVDGTGFNIAAAANWDSNLSNGIDLTGNPITVSNVQLPTIASASYNAATHVLTVTGANLVGVAGLANDITVAKLGLTGEGGVTRFLSTSGNVEVNSATSFSVTLSGADIAAVEALLNKNGSISAGGTSYVLSAGDDWNSVIGNANTAVSAAIVVVNNTSNSPPTITGAATAGVGDNATIKPFSSVTVADVNGDNVSMTISFNAANGALSGAGLSGSNGSYTLSAATPAALTAALKALTFTPTANQAAVGVNINTTFTLVATDANGASVTNTSTVITATSINDAPILTGTAAAQNMTAGGALHPFSTVTLSDPDVGASVIVTITPDSATKGAFTPASLSASGFVTTDGGVTYTLSAAAPGAAQAALQALIYKSAAGVSATTTFTVAVNDGSVIVSNNATTVVSAVPSGTTALSVAFSSDTGISNTDLITQTAAQNISGTLSSALLGNEKVEVSLDNGSTWTVATAATGSTSWQLNGQTLSGSGTLQVRVTNPGGSSTPLSTSYSIDTTAPTNTSASVAFSADTGASFTDLITKTAAQTISGTLSGGLVSGEHVEVSLNNGATWVTAAGSTGSNAWSLAGQTLTGSNTLQVRVVDAAGNAGAASSTAYTLDTTPPTVSMSSSVNVLKSGESAVITLTFNETPDNASLTLSDFTAVGGTLANLVATANPRVYTVEFTPNAGLSGLLGNVTLTNNSYTDLAGNSGAGATSPNISITTLGPSVVITSDVAALKTGESANLTFTFTSAPTGFTASDIQVSGGAISGFAPTGNALIYTAVFTPGANVSAPASVTVASGSYTDILGNQGGSGVSPVILVDTKAPTLAITSDLAAVKAGDVATITFTFSETPLGFTSGDVAVSGGTLTGFTGTVNPLVYTAQFTPSAGIASGAASITVAGSNYTDLIGNSGTAGTSPSISIDTVAPTTTGASFSFSADTGVSNSDLITRTAAQTVSGTLSAALAAGETVQVSMDNGVTWSNASASAGSGNWSLAGVTLAGSNTLQVRVNDAAGNHGAAYSAGYVLDTTAPTVLATSDLGALNAGQTATLTFSFSEAPANFSASSLTVTGGTISGLTQTANPLIYTATFTPAAGQLGVTATVQVNAGGYIDAAGNNGQASLTVPIAINTTLPSLLITADDVALKAGEAATLTFTFSTPPTGFTAADISYNNGILSGFAATANPLVYTAVFTPNAGVGSGSADISVSAGAYTDAFGNSGSGASGPAISIDTLAPTVAITSNVAAVKAGETAIVTFTFSELPLGFTAGDVVTTGGTLGSLTVNPGNPLVYTATFTPTAGIQNTAASITIAAGAFTDAAGNGNTGSVTPPISIDTLAPTAVANTVVFSVDSGSSPTDLVTNTSGQTISGTLASALGGGEFVEVSLDNGATWSTATGAGSAWSLSGQTLTASDTLKVRVTDAAGNHGATYSVAYVLDNTPPTATISSNVSAVKAGETATITFTFSEAPSGFDLNDVSASNGVLSNLTATANPLVYTATYTPATGVNGVTDNIVLTASSYTDKAGNAGSGATSPGISVDTQAPLTSGASVVFSSDSGVADLVTNVAAQNLSGTLSANLQGGETVEVSLDNGASWTSATASAGNNTWSLAGQTLSSGAGHNVQVRVSDAAGNHGSAYSAAYTLDQTPPTLAITSSKLVLNSADTPLITFTFSEAPIGFSAASVAVSGGTLSGFTATANPLVYTAIFTPLAGQAAGIGAVSVATGAYTDLAGNNGAGGVVPTITYATVAPGVAILSDVTALKAGDVANITFKFSSAPVGFTFGDITVNGGTLSGLSATADPLIYTAVFSATAGVANGSGAISIASGTFADTLGNLGVGGTMAAITVDTLAPTLAISSSASALNSTTTATITFTFSEAPASFTLGDIGASNGTISNLVQTANPLVYTALFTPAANVAGASAVISVAAGAYADLAGNGGAAGVSPGISIDTLAPTLGGGTVLFSADTGSSNTDLITKTAAQNIAGTLNGGVLAVGDVVEVSLNNGASWTTASASAGSNLWSLFGQTLNGNGTVQVRVSDANGNHGVVTTHNYVLDTTAPTVAVSSDTSTLRNGQSATISFTFSEAPSGFTLGDLIATGGTLSGFAATSNPLVYTVVLTPTPGFNGNASVTLGNNLYTDAAGNDGSGGSSPVISVDTLAPTLAITSSASALKAGDSATITFTFSDAPSAFALGSISASNGTLSGLAATSNPLVYTATFTPGAGIASANAVISVAGSVYADAAGNTGANVSSAPIAIDTLAPTASVLALSFSADNGASNSDLVTNAVSQIITGTLSAPVGAGEFVQVSLDNGATWLNAVTPAPGQWALLPQALTGSGTLQVRVSDAAGNHGSVFSAGYVLDLVAPTMTVTSSATTLKAGEAATLTFTFSEAPTGFTQSDLVPINGTLSGFAVSVGNPLVYTALFTPAAGLGGASAGVTLAPGMYTDLAGNAGGGALSPLITVDTAPPTLQITSSAANLKIGESATITFIFSELPLGFTLGDISVAGGTLSGFGLTANPLVYTALFTPTPGVSAGSGSIVVGAGSFLDAAGNASLAAAITPINYSTQAPNTGIATVAFGSDTGVSNTDLITTSPVQTISGTLDANVQSGDIVEVSVDNGASWTSAVAPVGGVNWALGTPVFLSGSGTLQVRVTDGAGNHGAAYSAAYVLDTTPPTMAISSNAAALKAGESATLTFTFSEAPRGFTAGDIVLPPGSGSISGFTVTANPLVYTAQFTPAAGYSLPAAVSVLSGSYTDTAGNAGGGAVSSPISIDAAPPTLLISSSLASLKIGDTALITFTFNEAPLGFAAGDVTATGGTLSGFTATANPLVYTAVFTPTPGINAGSAVISVAPNVYSDLAGNGGLGANTPSLSLDTLAPLAAATGTPVFSNDTGVAGDLITAISAQTVSGTLSAPLGAGESVQVSFDNGGTWNTAAASSNSWSLVHMLTASGVMQVRVIDTAGNYSAPTSTPYVFDQSAPTVTITSNVPVANGVEPAIITFNFSEAPVGFSNSNITVAGGTLGTLTPTSNPLVYTATFTPLNGVASGSATISVSGYTDVAGNTGGSAAIPSLQIDTVAPTAAASGGVAFSNDSGTGGDLITNNPNQTLSGTLSAPLAAGDVVQVSVDSGVTWHLATVSGTTWSLGRTLVPGTRALMVRVADAAGNVSTTHSVQYTLDTTAPTVTLSSSAATVGQGGSTTITLTLSDPGVLTQGDLLVTGGVISGFSGSGTTYTVVITPPANSTTPITINVGGGLFADAAGNTSTAATPLVVAVNTNPPPVNPGTPSTVDGVQITTQTGVDSRTGLTTHTITVPTITSSRPEDHSTEHANLADIPIGIAASNGNPGTSLVVSLPVGAGFEASGPASLVSGAMALTDLIGRIDDHTAAGQATRAAMETQAQEFLAGLAPNVLLQQATLAMSGSSGATGTVIIDGSDLVVAGGASGGPQHAATLDTTATALVIDARALPQGIGLQLDDVHFAAIIGGATITGGAGDNFFIGDGEAQRFVLTTGSDNDTLYGNGGDDVLITAGGNDYLNGGDGADQMAGGGGNDTLVGGAGNDVLQGGRSDSGQWQFYLKGGQVVAVHQTAMAGATGSEAVTSAELNHSVPVLAFSSTDVARLETLSLLYHAAFDRAPDVDGLNWWATETKGDTHQLAASFLQSTESLQGLMTLNNHDYVARLLTYTLDKTPDEAALAPYLARLNAAPGDLSTRADVLADIALTSAHRALWLTDDGLPLGGKLLTQEQGWFANSGNDRLEGGAGSDLLVGGDGTDTVVYGGAARDYSLALSSGGDVMIAEPEGSLDTIRQIELGEFNGVTLVLGFTQASTATLQELGMLYHLTLGRAGDFLGFGYWLDTGLQDAALGAAFLDSAEFRSRFGGMDDNTFVSQLYHNLGQQADGATLAKWDTYLDTHSRADLTLALAHDVTLVGSQFGANGMSLIASL